MQEKTVSITTVCMIKQNISFVFVQFILIYAGLVLFIIFLLTGYICLLIYDVMNPEIGFIRGGLQALFNMIFAAVVLTLHKAL